MCTLEVNCIDCLKMNKEEENIPKESIEYDFAEDALDFETQLADTRDVKYTESLTEPLRVGSHITCTGTPSAGMPWFSINIGCGEEDSPRADLAVHFNVRLPQHYVVRNTKRHEKWGSEETTAYRLFPFKIDRPFTIEILIDEKESLWAVDGVHYCSYAHRTPSALAGRWLQVSGVQDATLAVGVAHLYPTLAPPLIEVPERASVCESGGAAGDECRWQPNVLASLSNGIRDGHQLVIHGRLRSLLHSFTVDLLDEGREWPRAQVLLHVNMRAHAQPQLERQLVVLNAWLGAWGPEHRQRTAKLVPGNQTTLRIVRGPAEWSVFADGVLVGELEFRAAPSGVRALRLRGDLYPDHIYQCPASSSPIEDMRRP